MALATLSIDLEARLASMEKTFHDAVGLADSTSKQIASKFDAAGAAVKSAFGAVAVGLSVTAMASTVRSLIDGVDALNDFADATGSTVEMGSALEDVARRTGTSMDTVTAAVVKLNAGLKDTDPQSPVSLALKQIGLSAAELRQLDPSEALLRVAMSLRGFADDGDKARLVQELFGKSVRDVAPLLNDLADKGRLVATVTTEQAKEAEKFNQQLFAMSKNAEDARRSLLSELLPALNKVGDAIRQKGFGGAVLDALGFSDADFSAPAVTEKVRLLNQLTRELNTARQALQATPAQSPDAERWQRQINDLIPRVKAASKDVRESVDLINDLSRKKIDSSAAVQAEADRPSVGPLAGKPDTAAEDARRRAAEQALKQYQELIAKVRERQNVATLELASGEKLSAADQFREHILSLLEKGTSKLNQTQREQVMTALDTATAVMKANEAQQQRVKLMEDETRKLAQQIQQRSDEQRALTEELATVGLTVSELESLRIARLEDAIARKEQSIAAAELFDAESPALDQMREELELMRSNVALRREIVGKQDNQAKSPLAGAEQGVKQYLEEISRAGDATRDAVKGALGDLEDALTQFAMNGKLDVKSLVNSMLSEFIRLNAIRPLMQSLMSGAGGSGSGWLASAIGMAASFFGGGSGSGAGVVSGGSGITLDGVSASSGSASMYSLAGRATGGPVQADTAYLVGESGPEVAMFRQGGQILPAGLTRQLMQGAGGMQLTLQINQQVGEIVTPSQLASAMEATRRGAIAGVSDAMRRNRL